VRAVVTRVAEATVGIDDKITGSIGKGFLVLLGVHKDDNEDTARWPGFGDAARPEKAIPLYELVIKECKERGYHVETGEFGADMKVSSVNDRKL